MIEKILILLCLLATLPAEAQQGGVRELIRRQSLPTPADQSRIGRYGSFSNDALRALMRQSAFDMALSSILNNRSEFSPSQLQRLERDSGFDPQMVLRLERRSEGGPEDARRVQSASEPPGGWLSPVASVEFQRYLNRNSLMASSEFQLVKSEGGNLQIRVQRSSIPSPDFLNIIRLQSLGSDSESRLINRLSID